MDSSSSFSSSSNDPGVVIDYTNGNYYDIGYDSSTVMDAYFSEDLSTTDEFCCNFSDNNSTVTTDSCFGEYEDQFSFDSSSHILYEDTDSSSVDGGRAASYTTTSRSTPDSSLRSSSVTLNKGSLNIIQRVPRPTQNRGILKTKNTNYQQQNSTNKKESGGGEGSDSTGAVITHETLEKIRECELEDVLQYARDITNPDARAERTFCSQPVKVVQGSFKHMLSVRELYSKTGAFKYRTIDVLRNTDDEVGISVRKGDGWERDDGIYVSRISLGSVFDQYEILQVGDEIVHVNKVDVKAMSADDVIRLMHIPEKLSITVKMLTPFSKKRVERSGIEELKKERFMTAQQNTQVLQRGGRSTKNQRKTKAKPVVVVSSSRSNECLSKVAHLQIGTPDRRYIRTNKRDGTAVNKMQNGSILDNNGNDESPNLNSGQRTTVKISPYRTMSVEGTGRNTRQCLSPIREFSSTPTLAQRKQSYVRWFDEG